MKKYCEGSHEQLVALNKDISTAQIQLSQCECNLKRAYKSAFKNDKQRYQQQKGILSANGLDKAISVATQPFVYKAVTVASSLLSGYIIVCELLIMFHMKV